MRPGGRLVLLTWQPFARNEWQIAFFTALAAGRDLPTPTPGPFPLNDPDRVRPLLRSAGFGDVAVRALSEPMYFGPDPDDADNLRASMSDHQTEGGVYYDSAAWLIEAQRS
ncbi:MAG TPA: hypothetical protein VFW64_11365 [Pseudonocardiaceae bacterium]|nr:hypothetical protein [Pseudonocardiaceae bacterium]